MREGARQHGANGPTDAARRMLLTTIGITAVVAVGVFAWSLVRGDDDPSIAAADDWDRIAVVDRTTGAVTTYDRDGRQIGRTTGTGRVLDVYAHGARMALVGSSEIVVTDVADAPASVTVTIPPGSSVVPLETSSTMHLLVGDPAGGNLLIVDLADGGVVDVGALAAPTVPKLFVDTVQVDADGTTFAVADAANFQTIVVGDDIEGAVFLADQPVAVGDELVATSQVVNRQADIALVALDRRNRALVATELPSGGIVIDDELTMVSVDGGVFRIGEGDDEAERIGTVPLSTGATVSWARPSYLGQRIVVAGTDSEAIVDLDGAVLFSTTFASPTDVIDPKPGWRCVAVGSADDARSLVDLGTGEVRGDLTGLAVAGASADGCRVIGTRDGALHLIDGDTTVRLGVVRDAALSPDGRAVVWTTTSGRTELVTIDGDEPSDPVALPGAPTNLAVAFLAD